MPSAGRIKVLKEVGYTDEDIKKWNAMPTHGMLQKEWAAEVEKAGVKGAAKVMERMKEIVAQGIAKDRK